MSKLVTTFKSTMLRWVFAVTPVLPALYVSSAVTLLVAYLAVPEAKWDGLTLGNVILLGIQNGWGLFLTVHPLLVIPGIVVFFLMSWGGKFGLTHYYLHHWKKPTETVDEVVKPAIEERKPIGPAERPVETDQSKSRIRRRRRRR